jgi:hypothetical protein
MSGFEESSLIGATAAALQVVGPEGGISQTGIDGPAYRCDAEGGDMRERQAGSKPITQLWKSVCWR